MSEIPSDSMSETSVSNSETSVSKTATSVSNTATSVSNSETSDSKTATSDSKTETSVSTPIIARDREPSSLKSQPQPVLMVTKAVDNLERIGGDAWKLIKLNMESKEEGKGPSGTPAGTPIDWQTYLYTHVLLLQGTWRSAVVCENESENLERMRQNLREGKDSICEPACKLASMAIQISDFNRDRAEENYYQAEVNFYLAVVEVCQTMITRLSALVCSSDPYVQSVSRKFKEVELSFASLRLCSTLKLTLLTMRGFRERLLILQMGSCLNASELGVSTPCSILVRQFSSINVASV